MHRRQDVELLRIISAFGIVWFHSRAAGGAIAYGGLVVFLILSVYLGGKSGGPDLGTITRRARRLLIPWLFWFAVYAGMNISRGEGVISLDQGVVSGVMAGPSIHLWYLPFIFLGLTFLDVVKAHAAASPLGYASAGVAIVGVATSPWWRAISLTLPYPALQWADAATPIAMGLFLANAHALPRLHRAVMSAVLIACCLAVTARNSIGVSYGLGFAACALVASGKFKDSISINLGPLSELSFGIYLSHILIFDRLLQYTTISNELIPFVIYVTAAVLVAILRKLFPRWQSYWS